MLQKIKNIIRNKFYDNTAVKNSYYEELMSSFDEEKCIICSLIDKTIENYLDNSLYEFTMDPVSRKIIRQSLGYCAKHTLKFINVIKNTNQRLSANIISKDITNYFLGQCNSSLRSAVKIRTGVFKKRKNCPVCKYQGVHESIYILEFIRGAGKKEFLERYNAKPGLCFEHLAMISGSVKNFEILKKIIEPQVAVLEDLDRDLNGFIKKFDYKNKKVITEGEAQAWIKLLGKINKT